MSSLLDAEFLRRLERLRLAARRRFAGASGGARASLRRGASVEFADHRAYSAGDDIRRIDWNAYARLEELVLRLYVAEEDLRIYLLVDSSASMGFGEPSKLVMAQRLAAALSYVALCGSERVSVIPWAAKAAAASAPARGRGRVGSTFRFLENIRADGETDLGACVEAMIARRMRPGLVMIMSDFLDPAGYETPIDRLLASRFEPALFHVLSEEEVAPTLDGDHRFVDSENGSYVDLSMDPHVLDAYDARLTAFLNGLESYARKRGVRYARLVGHAAFETLLTDYLRAS